MICLITTKTKLIDTYKGKENVDSHDRLRSERTRYIKKKYSNLLILMKVGQQSRQIFGRL